MPRLSRILRQTRCCSELGCDGPMEARGLCSSHYRMAQRRGTLPPRERRAAGWVVMPSGCWEWTGRIDGNGYGTYANQRAHRVVYEQRVGPIPEGLTLDHLCRNHPCVNPAHLEPVTQSVNTLRGESPAARNARKGECIRGHAFTAENTYNRPDDGNRQCRTCLAERERRRPRRPYVRRRAA